MKIILLSIVVVSFFILILLCFGYFNLKKRLDKAVFIEEDDKFINLVDKSKVAIVERIKIKKK